MEKLTKKEFNENGVFLSVKKLRETNPFVSLTLEEIEEIDEDCLKTWTILKMIGGQTKKVWARRNVLISILFSKEINEHFELWYEEINTEKFNKTFLRRIKKLKDKNLIFYHGNWDKMEIRIIEEFKNNKWSGDYWKREKNRGNIKNNENKINEFKKDYKWQKNIKVEKWQTSLLDWQKLNEDDFVDISF